MLTICRSLVAAALSLAAVVLAITGCSSDGGSSAPAGLPACSSATLMPTSPLAYADIREIAPLGNLNPSGHTFPTDHIYLYLQIVGGITASVPVVSPGNIRVSSVTLQKRTGGGTAEFDDYGLSFYPCSTVSLYFGHVTTLATGFSAKVGALDGSCNAPYQTGGSTFQQCVKNVDIAVSAGEAIGTAGGPGQGALDLGAIDNGAPALAYVDPSRTAGQGGGRAACPADYFVPAVLNALLPLFAVNGHHRTIAPVCGTVMQDVANTAQGRWFFDATTNDDHHLALVHTSWDPTIGAFSIGTSVPGTTPAVLMFTPAQVGRVNLDFNRVTTDGQIYCYQFTNSITMTVYIQLQTNSHLRIQANPTGSCGDPATWVFGTGAVGFDR
jgi:hypothetical protein